MLVVGVDGCKGGWIAIALRDGAFAEAFFAEKITTISARFANASRIGIDIPIGTEPNRFRQVDEAARKHLGSRRSSVFETPPIEVLRIESFDDALAHCRKLTEKGLSKQIHGLRRKILEVHEIVTDSDRVIEVHPEVSFFEMLNGTALANKKTWAGVWQRRGALANAGIHLPDDLGADGQQAAVDDVLDAAGAAWSAHRCATGKGASLGPAVRDARGREIAIWY